MKRALLLGLLLVGANVLGGCPIYPSDDYACASSSDCPNGWACDYATGYCYELPSTTPTGKSCTKPSDCGANETCGKTGRCGIGSCSFHGCVSGYTCEVASGVWACVESSDSGGAAGAAGAAGGGGVAGAAGASGAAGAGGASGGSAGSSSGGVAGGDAGNLPDASSD